MATLVRQHQLPTASQVALLQELGRAVSIRHSELIPGATISQVVLSSPACEVKVAIEYHDLEFKFEYFYLNFRPLEEKKTNDVLIVEDFGFDEILFLIRGEWKDVDSQGSEVFKRGPVDAVPSTALASIACVGIELRDGNGQLLLGIADGFPLVMEISQDNDVIRAFESDCTIVNIDNAVNVFDGMAKSFVVST